MSETLPEFLHQRAPDLAQEVGDPLSVHNITFSSVPLSSVLETVGALDPQNIRDIIDVWRSSNNSTNVVKERVRAFRGSLPSRRNWEQWTAQVYMNERRMHVEWNPSIKEIRLLAITANNGTRYSFPSSDERVQAIKARAFGTRILGD